MAVKESFRNMIKVANRRITVKHPTTYSRHTEEKAKTTLAKVGDIIATFNDDLESVSFTTELQTAT